MDYQDYYQKYIFKFVKTYSKIILETGKILPNFGKICSAKIEVYLEYFRRLYLFFGRFHFHRSLKRFVTIISVNLRFLENF